MLLMPVVMSADHRGAPVAPFFVKMWITPLDASVPYSVVAAAPLITSIRSMSAALMSFRGDDDCRAAGCVGELPP